MKQITQYKYTSLALALTSALFISSFSANAETTDNIFEMYDGTGGYVGGASDVIADRDFAAGTWRVSSTTPFFGQLWTAHDGIILGEGTHTIDTIEGGIYTITVGPGQVGGHILFDWGVTTNIDVINIWDVTGGGNIYTSTDIDNDGILGLGMIDGPFIGFNANFNIVVTPPFTIDLSTSQNGTQTSTLDSSAGNITFDSGVSGGTYDWSSTDAALLAVAVGGTTNQTLVVDPLTLDGNYTASVEITKSGYTDTATLNASIIGFTFSSNDTDGDGVIDSAEGAGDADSDGIPNFLDDSRISAQQIKLASNAVITSDAGALTLGSLVTARGVATLVDNATAPELAASAFLPEMTITELGADAKAVSSCVGGCYEFNVTDLTAGGTVNITIPLSSAIPANAVYRKSVDGNWKGFEINANNSLASAPASSTGPTVCPSADSTAYTTGLTKGDFCVRLTMNDGGANDGDKQANGTLVDPGGVGTSNQSNLEDTSSAIDGVGGGWWFLMGLPALIGLRRFTNSK